jgi:hypothetical protein
MSTHIPYESWKLRSEYARHLDTVIKPNVAVTATLCQSRSYENDRGSTWMPGEPIAYEGILTGLTNRLSAVVLGNAYRRYGKRLRVAGSLEGDGVGQAFHLHVCIHRPDGQDPAKFAGQLRTVWAESPWLKQDLDVQEIHGNWVWYTTKRGPEALLFP